MKLFIFILLFSSSVFANTVNQFEVINYKTTKKDSFAKIISRFVKADSIINQKEPMVIKTREENPQIKNWRKIPENTGITLYIDKKFLDRKKIAEYEQKYSSTIKRNDEFENKIQGVVNYGFSEIHKKSEILVLTNMKMGGIYTNKLNKNFHYTTGLSINKIFNFIYTDESDPATPNNFYLEFSFFLYPMNEMFFNRKFLLGYEILNYFVIQEENKKDIVFSQQSMNRLSVGDSYIYDDTLRFRGSFGLLAIVGEENLLGLDIKPELLLTVGKHKKHEIGFESSLGYLAGEDSESFMSFASKYIYRFK